MALARVVSFEGVSRERIAELSKQIEEGERQEELPATEMILLHDPDATRRHEDDYGRGDGVLSAMPADDTPGRRASVAKFEVAAHVTG
jgi:hypothetical protein